MTAAVSRVLPATAQGNGATCQLSVQALTSAGPSYGQAYGGVLEFTMGNEGAIDRGTFTPDGGISAPVVGEFEGRAIDLRITFADGQALVLSGTGENPIEICSGALSGVFSGPHLGDTGSWMIDPSASLVTVNSGLGGTTPIAGATATATATATPSCPGVECDSTYVVDPVTCECVCPTPYEACGPVCCPSGSVCMDEASGECSCPDGTELCGDACVDVCPMQTYRDHDTCECVEGCNLTCSEGEELEPDKCICVNACPPANSYYCAGNCYAEAQVMCSGQCYSATSVNSNAQMCGLSCQVCPDGVPCIGGSCQCPATYTYCPGGGCKSLSDDNDNCGSCGNYCTGGKTCQGGMCQA